jgi:hypothetical protein
MSEGEVQPLQEGRVFCVNVLTIFWLRILTRERVKEVTQGRYEGWVGGGGWAEDMEGRSVLSLTLVYIIFLDCSSRIRIKSIRIRIRGEGGGC